MGRHLGSTPVKWIPQSALITLGGIFPAGFPVCGIGHNVHDASGRYWGISSHQPGPPHRPKRAGNTGAQRRMLILPHGDTQ